MSLNNSMIARFSDENIIRIEYDPDDVTVLNVITLDSDGEEVSHTLSLTPYPVTHVKVVNNSTSTVIMNNISSLAMYGGSLRSIEIESGATAEFDVINGTLDNTNYLVPFFPENAAAYNIAYVFENCTEYGGYLLVIDKTQNVSIVATFTDA